MGVHDLFADCQAKSAAGHAACLIGALREAREPRMRAAAPLEEAAVCITFRWCG